MVQYSLTQKNKQYNRLVYSFLQHKCFRYQKSKTTFYLGSPFPENHVIRKYWSFYGTIFLTCEGVQKLNRVHKRFEKFRTKDKKLSKE
jgi:hypothetical protein